MTNDEIYDILLSLESENIGLKKREHKKTCKLPFAVVCNDKTQLGGGDLVKLYEENENYIELYTAYNDNRSFSILKSLLAENNLLESYENLGYLADDDYCLYIFYLTTQYNKI